MQSLLSKLRTDYQDVHFVEGSKFSWSPQSSTITFKKNARAVDGAAALLHELAHARLKHAEFITDFELLKIESEAWGEAQKLASSYNIAISDDHIQASLDTYRDWLHMRSTCPRCTNNGLQNKLREYHCLNCGTAWSVSRSRLCRPYRKIYQ